MVGNAGDGLADPGLRDKPSVTAIPDRAGRVHAPDITVGRMLPGARARDIGVGAAMKSRRRRLPREGRMRVLSRNQRNARLNARIGGDARAAEGLAERRGSELADNATLNSFRNE